MTYNGEHTLALSLNQTDELKRLCEGFEDILTDIPGHTTLGEHTIRLTCVDPIRTKPYPLPHALHDEIQKEVELMEQMGVVSSSNSPYASPLVVVKKPDGTKRICCDLRKDSVLHFGVSCDNCKKWTHYSCDCTINSATINHWSICERKGLTIRYICPNCSNFHTAKELPFSNS